MKRLLLLLVGIFALIRVEGQEITYHHSIYHTFIENKGQWNNQVLFMDRTELGNVWVQQKGVLFQLLDYSKMKATHFGKNKLNDDNLTFQQQLIWLEFVGAQSVHTIHKVGKSKQYYNYFIGNNSDKWASEVHGYTEFTLRNLYKGIDLHYIEESGQIKYQFEVDPGIETEQIQLKYSFPKKIKIDKKGNLVVVAELGKIIEQKPKAYQIINGKIVNVPCQFKLKDGIVSFQLGEYNKNVRLIIDPTLVFATYNGAGSDNFGMTATYGYDGSAYAGGIVYGNSYPMPAPNVYDPNSNLSVVSVGIVTTDVFITRYSPDGKTMLWSTFLGGGDNTQGTEVPHSLICDQDNNIYIYGTTSSTDFPIVNGFQTTFGGGSPFRVAYNGVNYGAVGPIGATITMYGTDIYVAKISNDGHQLLGSTYVGGSKNDGVNYISSAGNYNYAGAYDSLTTNYGDQFRGEIMLDSANNIIVGSCARSSDFPTKNAFQPTIGGLEDGVIFKLKADFSGLIFSSYYGGAKEDAIYSVKIDSSENIVFVGGTTSTDLVTTTGCYQSSYAGGTADGFIVKLTPNGQSILYSTYVGTPNYDQIFFVDLDRANNVFVLGQSNGGDFPVINAPYSNPGSSQFIARFDSDLSTIEASTVFGSGSPTFDISPSAFMVDVCGNMYVSGWGGSVLVANDLLGGMPVTPNAYQPVSQDGHDFYLIVIQHGFSGLLYGTYMGGPLSEGHVDGGTSRFDKNGVVYQCVCCGCGGHSDFPTTPGAWSSTNNSSNCNALVFKFDFNLIPNASFTVDQFKGCAPLEIHFDNFSSDSDEYMWHFGDGDSTSTVFQPVKTYTDSGTYKVWLTVTDSVCALTDTAELTIQVYPEVRLDSLDSITICDVQPITLTANSRGTATKFIWSSSPHFSDTLNNLLTDSSVVVTTPHDGYYYVKGMNDQGCEYIDSLHVVFVGAHLTIFGHKNLCEDESTTFRAFSDNEAITFTNFDWGEDDIIVSGDGTNEVVIMPDTTQYLHITATASNGCIIHDSVLLTVSPKPSELENVLATATQHNVPIGGLDTLMAQPDGFSYQWTPTEGVKNPNSQITEVKVKKTTVYTVTVSDGVCSTSDTVIVHAFDYICDRPFIYVPNAFTPNGDGENDLLRVRSHVIKSMIFRVYDRWGEKVFESKRPKVAWNGTYKGKSMDPDVYDYYLKGKCIDGQDFLIKGNITLIR